MAHRSSRSEFIAVALFLLSALAANLLVDAFGQPALLVTAWVLIPFDLLTRDVLHDRWHGKHLWARMGLLILCGAALTWWVAPSAGMIAVASFVAFSCAGLTNTCVYELFLSRTRFARMNISNLASACVDSLVFPFIAFGVSDTSLALCAGQAASKFCGGLLWSSLYLRFVARHRS
jgi:uncharacterized PurR-regulated membrane protein YhhQ (DUF165 family)